MKNILNRREQLFRKAVTYDNPNISADKAIEERLNYYFSLKQPRSKIHMNSFSGMFLWIFSIKSMGFKASLASVVLAYFLFFGNIKNGSDSRNYSDTCRIHTLLADTNYLVKDTCKK
jgi:hypothetical protein